MKLFFFSFILVFPAITIFSQNWQLVWSDEFDSTSLNLNNWTYETGGGGWGNNELEYYTNRDVNSYIEDGMLIIKAQQENFGGRSYTSARLKTQEKRFWQYGKIEARIKLPYGQGIWPAFWMLGETISLVGWPACGETDIMEMIGGQGRENTVYGTAHWDNSGQHAQYGGHYTLASGTFADSFHVYRIEWDQNSIKWYVDDSHYATINITPSGLSEFHQEFFIILNLAVGGNWPGNPDSSTTFPQYLEIDYVRVYQLAPTGIPNEGSLVPQFKLEQNYPNPFNPSTNFGFRISDFGLVSLKIYDIFGREAATVIEKELEPGEYHFPFSISPASPSGGHFPLSSGVYFYRLTSLNYSETKKMILMK